MPYLRLVVPCPPPSNASSTPPSATSPPTTLGNKLQRIALLAPMYLTIIEAFADRVLSRLDGDHW